MNARCKRPEFAEESFKQGKLALDRFLSVTRKMAEDWEHHAFSIREHATALTEKTLSNTMDFGEKVSRAKDPQEFAKCQSEFARQAQTLADGTKEFSEKMQQASRSFASNASSAMAEATRRVEETASNIGSRAEQNLRRQQQRAGA